MPDGWQLRIARFGPKKTALGTVLLCQGRAEYIEKYYPAISRLTDQGYHVLTFDWRGQGGSGRLLPKQPRKGHIQSFESYEKDLEHIIKTVLLLRCPAPYTMMAHSTGAAIALSNSLYGQTRFDRMILSAPLLALPALPCLDARHFPLVSHLFSGMGLSKAYVFFGGETLSGSGKFDGNSLTGSKRQYARMQAYMQDYPQLGLGSPTIGWVRACCRYLSRFDRPEFVGRLHVPTLFLLGTDEKIVSRQAIDRVAFAMPCAERLLLPGARHELFMETEAIQDTLWTAIEAFLHPDLRHQNPSALEESFEV